MEIFQKGQSLVNVLEFYYFLNRVIELRRIELVIREINLKVGLFLIIEGAFLKLFPLIYVKRLVTFILDTGRVDLHVDIEVDLMRVILADQGVVVRGEANGFF